MLMSGCCQVSGRRPFWLGNCFVTQPEPSNQDKVEECVFSQWPKRPIMRISAPQAKKETSAG